MERRETICSICGKSKAPNNSGRVSQFISICVCSLNANDDNDDAPITICSDCGKKIDTGRIGSMTQFVLRAELCQCNIPNPRTNPDASQVNNSQTPVFTGYLEDIEEQYEELDIAEDEFPLDRYEPIRKLGSGASGNVYLAKDKLLKKNVAVKVLQVLTNEQLVSFQDEAKTTSKLDHPSIINILDFGATESGTPFMALEYFRGITLEDKLKDYGPLDWETARIIFTQICKAISYAHGQGIYHRDLKPSNILLNLDDMDNIQVRLIDFGLAKVSELTGKTTEFQGKTLVGTPYYMSPDAAKGFDYNEKSEIYSIGCILFESLSGKPPFKGNTALETLSLHAKEKVPLISSVGDMELPIPVESLIAKCLAKLPEDRFSNALELGIAIEDATSTSDTDDILNPNKKPNHPHQSKNTRVKSAWLIVLSCLLVAPVILVANTIFNTEKSRRSSKSTPKAKLPKSDSPYNYSYAQSMAVIPQLEKEVFKEKSFVIYQDTTDKDLVNLKIPLDVTALSINSDLIIGAGFKTLNKYKLKLLELTCPMLNDAGAKEIAKISSLEEIDLNNAQALSAKGYEILFSGPNLRSLHVKYTTLPPGAIEGISKNPNISSIVFSSCKFANEADLGNLSKLPNLAYLRLSNLNLSSFGYSQIAKLKHLDCLSIAGISFDTKECESLAQITIPLLRFSECAIGDKAFIKLAKVKNLKTLYLIKHSGTSKHYIEKFRSLRPEVNLDPNADSATVKQLKKDLEIERKLRRNATEWITD